MNKNQMPNAKGKMQKGITLIALIITVIVLLILAGTAVSIAINGGDIFGKASQAREGWNSAVATEQEKINDVMSLLNTVTGENNGGGANTTPTPAALPAEWGETAATYVSEAYTDGTADTRQVPIPKGFKVSIYNDALRK